MDRRRQAAISRRAGQSETGGIQAGLAGTGLRHSRLVVSPQHRMLLDGPDIRACIGADQALAHAYSILALYGGRRKTGSRHITDISLPFDHHEIIFAEGVSVESLYAAPMISEVLSAHQRLQIIAAVSGFRASASGCCGPMARPVPNPPQARRPAQS